jgi:hypothetical protein
MNINVPNTPLNHHPNNDNPNTFFSRILQAAQPVCEPFLIRRERHMAKAILASRRGGHMVILQYEPQLSLLSLVLELGKVSMPAKPRFFTTPYLPAGASLTTTTICGEDGTAWLRTASLLCPCCQEPRTVVRSLISDLQRSCDGQAWLR